MTVIPADLKATFQLQILGVKKNPQSPMYTQLGVLTKGTVIEVNVSELGMVTAGGKVVFGKYAQVTNNPENDGCINAVLREFILSNFATPPLTFTVPSRLTWVFLLLVHDTSTYTLFITSLFLVCSSNSSISRSTSHKGKLELFVGTFSFRFGTQGAQIGLLPLILWEHTTSRGKEI